MSHTCSVISNPNFHTQLFALDLDTAADVKTQGCRHCGGKLHQANYSRTGFGLSPQISPIYSLRFSFCCANCRRRTTPPSMRFFGRRRYPAALFVLLCASRLVPDERTRERLVRRFGLHLSLST